MEQGRYSHTLVARPLHYRTPRLGNCLGSGSHRPDHRYHQCSQLYHHRQCHRVRSGNLLPDHSCHLYTLHHHYSFPEDLNMYRGWITDVLGTRITVTTIYIGDVQTTGTGITAIIGTQVIRHHSRQGDKSQPEAGSQPSIVHEITVIAGYRFTRTPRIGITDYLSYTHHHHHSLHGRSTQLPVPGSQLLVHKSASSQTTGLYTHSHQHSH